MVTTTEEIAPDNPILVAVLQLADRGIPVFPCAPTTKRPLTLHAFKDASTDPDQLRGWWSRMPTAMIGIPMGEASGRIAIDLDLDEERG